MFGYGSFGSPSAAAQVVGEADAIRLFSQPYCSELPAVILALATADPDGVVGLGFRRYCKTSLIPAVQRVAAILRGHDSMIEWPSKAW